MWAFVLSSHYGIRLTVIKRVKKGFKMKISKMLKNLLRSIGEDINRALFRYQVKQGFILCIGEEPEEVVIEPEEVTEEIELGEGETVNEEVVEPENEEVVVAIEGEEPPEEETAPAPEWVKELRKNHREVVRKNRELEEKLQAVTAPQQKPVVQTTKPTLESCDYDAERFERDLEAWHAQKQAAEAEERSRQAAQAEANRAWQATLEGYGKAKTELKVKDFNEVEDVVKDTLSITQQGIILQGCKNAALTVYALGKNPKKAKELAAIKDPVKFAFAIADLENKLKVTNRKSAPPPERTVRGSGPVSGTVDSQLDRLRAEAEKTGNYTKVNAYKMQQRQKQK